MLFPHVWFKSDTLQPAPRAQRLRASPPSQWETEPPAWQRPGSRVGVAGPGARSVQRHWQGGRARGPQGRRAQARSLLGNRWQSPHPRHPPRRVGVPPPVLALTHCPEMRGSEPGVGAGFPAGVPGLPRPGQGQVQDGLPAAAPTHPLQPEGPQAALRECRPGRCQANSPNYTGTLSRNCHQLGASPPQPHTLITTESSS